MNKNITPNDCKSMFSDKLNSMSMKELGIELKHFAIGTAPEYPSYLVNQDILKNQLIDKFYNFFDPNRSQGLEVVFLRSNYGNGKSHFIRTIHAFLSVFENVLAKKVSLKQEKTDLKTKILEGVGQKTIKDSATFFVNLSVKDLGNDNKDAILLDLSEKYAISSKLSLLIYDAAINQDISKQSQAIAILKGNYLPAYLKSFGLKRADVNNEFYFDVIRLVCNYLYKCSSYLVIVFDEYEHVYSWKDSQARKVFFEDIKYFTDNISTYKNLFFVFAESESVNNDIEASDDPAYVSRKKGRTYQIESISSEAEVQNLFEMIKARYEKYYDVSFDSFVENILEEIKSDAQVKSNSNYRNYTQVIMRILDQYKDYSSQERKRKKINENPKEFADNSTDKSSKGKMNLFDKWESATSISKKTILCDALEHILNHSNEEIIIKSKKRGYYQTQNQQLRISYHIIATDKPSSSGFIKRYNDALRMQSENEVARSIILYPYKKETNDEFKYENVIFYDVDNVPSILEKMYTNTETIKDVFSYLTALEMGR